MSKFRIACLVLVGIIGGVVASPKYPAYYIPASEGALPLRMAMVEETLFEEFPVHTKEYYEERNASARQAGDLDDLAVGLDKLGRSQEAVEILREKLAAQKAEGLSGRELYTTYANLGTALIHANFKQAIDGDSSAIAAVREGKEFVAKSVEVNPQAHYGREKWQMHIVGFILQAIDSPEVLLETDCLGNRLDRERPVGNLGPGGFFYINPAFGSRDDITQVGQPPVAFDQPMLGIIGMWQVGGGANPHFSLAMAETLDRVGELELAWVAYARTKRMRERFWPDEELQNALVDYCEARQEKLEAHLGERGELKRYLNREKRALQHRLKARVIERQVKTAPDSDFYKLYRESLQGG